MMKTKFELLCDVIQHRIDGLQKNRSTIVKDVGSATYILLEKVLIDLQSEALKISNKQEDQAWILKPTTVVKK